MNKLITIILIAAIGGLLWSVSGFFSLGTRSQVANTPVNYQRAVQVQGPDKCQAPEGYTDQEWREHMSHHPDQYAECLTPEENAVQE